MRILGTLRKKKASFNAKIIQEESGFTHVSTKTIQILVKNDYRYRQSRKKGLLTPANKKKRLAFARNAAHFAKDFWTNKTCFYFDGVRFATTHMLWLCRSLPWHGENLERVYQ